MDLVALSNGLHGSVQMDSVALFSWIGWLRHHGIFTLIIGISLVLGFIVSFWSEIIIDYIILPAVIVGLGFILYGQFKYNKGIF